MNIGQPGLCTELLCLLICLPRSTLPTDPRISGHDLFQFPAFITSCTALCVSGSAKDDTKPAAKEKATLARFPASFYTIESKRLVLRCFPLTVDTGPESMRTEVFLVGIRDLFRVHDACVLR